MTRTQLTDHEVFWLARYAHNRLAPLFAELKTIEPSIYTSIEMRFPDKDSVYASLNGVQVSVHWAREPMFLQSAPLVSTADIDELAAEVRADIEKLRAETLAVV